MQVHLHASYLVSIGIQPLPDHADKLSGAQDVRRQLYSDKDDREIFSTIQDQLRRIDKRLEDGRAALQHLEMALINVACDDPGAAIGAQLVLPLLQVPDLCCARPAPVLQLARG